MPRRKQFSLEDYKEVMLNKTFGFIIVIDVYKDPVTNRSMCKYICKCGKIKDAEAKRIFSGKLLSCGCYKSSDEFKSKVSHWFKDNPDKVKKRSEKYSEWCINNPDKVQEKAAKYSEWCKNNSDKNANRINTISNIKKDIRLNSISLFNTDELSKIHPDDLSLILNGSLKGSDLIRVCCPNCGNYDYHRFDSTVSLTNKTVAQLLCDNCNIGKSHYEDDLYNYIVSLNCDCIKNDRSVLDGKELDLYIPDKKLAIEFNGTYWHSELNKDKYYHYDKFIQCINKGIRLISIYEYDYRIPYKRIKILQIIKHVIIKNESIYARNCNILNIDINLAHDFINKYHFDDTYKKDTIAYGLYYNNELVSCMTFRKLRNKNDHYELTRFVSLPNIHIIGGISKLFKQFIKNYNPYYISSYSDNDLFDGHSYSILGFSLVSHGRDKLDYNWVKNKEVLSRQQCTPYKLLKQYPKYNNIKIIGLKEKYIMEDLGYYRIYRCGNSKWQWCKNT